MSGSDGDMYEFLEHNSVSNFKLLLQWKHGISQEKLQ